MPVIGPWVHPGYSVVRLYEEERITDTELLMRTEFQQSPSSLGHSANAKLPKEVRLGVMVSAHSNVEIPEEEQVL